MDRILKAFKLIDRSNSLDFYEEISLLTYLANLTESEILTNEIETASNAIHLAFKNLYDNYYDVIEIILKEEKDFIILTDKLNGNSFKIFIRNTWLFRIILLNSVKHMDVVNNVSHHVSFFNSVVKQILKNIDLLKSLSLYLLRTLSVIVTKRKDILTANMSVTILKQMDEVALSPITAFRQYARGISKAVIPFLAVEKTIFLDISLLPLKGIDMCDVVKCFPEDYIRKNKITIIKKVMDMFQKNVESKDAGLLYESFLFYSFEEWKIEIWPLFVNHLKCIDYEGEFFQSLLKYWITSNVNSYKSQFYHFLRNEAIDWRIKGYILLESRKRGFIIHDDVIKLDISSIFCDIETRNLGLRIATTYHKKSLWPMDYEIYIVMNYVYTNTNPSLEEEEAKSFRFFFSQIFLHAHNKLRKSAENLSTYISVIESIYKYCCASLKTDFFEIGAEVTNILWTIATGNYKSLQLNYKLEKKDCYTDGENLFYKKLKESNMWWFETETFQRELIDCFHRNNGSSPYLTKLFTRYFYKNVVLSKVDLKSIVNESVIRPGLDGEKRVKNYSETIFCNQYCEEDNLQFLQDVNNFLINSNLTELKHYSEDEIFKIVLYLETLLTAVKCSKYPKQNLHIVVDRSLTVIENIINGQKPVDTQDYRLTKIIEALMNSVMTCLTENSDILWATINKEKVIEQLIFVIQKSNMKRPLSLSVEVLKRFALKMNENDSDMNYKIYFVGDTLNSLCQNATKSDLKIRRNPESRLVLHALCCSDENSSKPILNWVMTHLLQVLSDSKTSDSALASALHTVEILISDNSLQAPTLPFVSDLIIQCVELFSKRSWIVRNADLQLTRAIIDRFYGVCLDICNRPKSVEDLLVLFPNLSSYFFEILSSENLDERTVLVLQFFLESQVKEHICTPKVAKERFLRLFTHILQTHANHIGKMAARSYCALCIDGEIPKNICSVIRFCKHNFGFLSMNILTNFLFLIQLLYEKYKNSFYHFTNEKPIRIINFAIYDLLKHIGKRDPEVFNFVLFTVKSQSTILDEFLNNLDERNFQKRLWLHNNVPYLLINSKSNEVPNVLRTVLSNTLLSCIQIKILSILIARLENNELDQETCTEILEILFENSVLLQDTDHYLLNCYFKTILVVYRFQSNSQFRTKLPQLTDIKSFYKILILVLYFSQQKSQLDMTNKEIFYSLTENIYLKFNSLNEEMKNDIISTLPYAQNGAPIQHKLKIFKIIFYTSLFTSTHLEAYKCISFITGKSYSSMLNALKDFLSIKNLILHLKNKMLVSQFLSDVLNYVPEHFQEIQRDGYYTEESDILVPKSFLLKILNKEMQNL